LLHRSWSLFEGRDAALPNASQSLRGAKSNVDAAASGISKIAFDVGTLSSSDIEEDGRNQAAIGQGHFTAPNSLPSDFITFPGDGSEVRNSSFRPFFLNTGEDGVAVGRGGLQGPSNTSVGLDMFAGEIGIFFAGAQLKCLDLAGGDTSNGNKIQLWDCNGRNNQKWFFKAGSWSIHSSLDTSKCIDIPGGRMVKGNSLQIWDCAMNNNYPIDGQKFGYDQNAMTIFATNSQPIQCIDLPGGDTKNGNELWIWDCNNQDENQKWTFTMPGPQPTSQLPTFNTQADLQANSAWAKYLTTVYGELPNQGFPLKTSDLWMIYGTIAKQSGVLARLLSIPANIPQCPSVNKDLMLFSEGCAYQVPGSVWIWHAGPSHYGPAKGNSWTEVLHQKDPFGDEHFGAWFIYAYGSGIYFWTGTTETYDDHPNAFQKYGVHDNEALCKAAASKNVDSIQFINRRDTVNWPCQKNGVKNMGFEIVGVKLKGLYNCGSDGSQHYSQLRSGWWASKPCNCQVGTYLNCGNPQ
jgi:hypothetical protein